ncbi:MAG: RNA-guided endonuclease InsQ/TnpB family protein [Brasilonema sp.]
MAYKAFRTRLKLNNQQRTVMAQHAGYSRWVYNWGLKLWEQAYKDGLKPSVGMLKKFFTNHVKPQYQWMSELSSKVYQYAFINLGEAFKRFFGKKGKYPRFKKKGKADSFTIDNSGAPIKIGGLRHKAPFIGWVRTYEALPECVTKKVTISQQAGDWYLSFHVEIPEAKPMPKSVERVGVDLGVNALATLSTGAVYPNLKAYRKAKHKLARLQRSASRKQNASNNRHKANRKVARQHRRVASIRNDYLHKITTYLAKNHVEVVIEDLNVSGMLANHKLASAISDCGFYEFRRQLEYKCERYGSNLVVVDRFYPSSQICSGCGHRQKMPLKERVYICPCCNISRDRDLNAAINLSNWGRLSPGKPVEQVPPTVCYEAGSKRLKPRFVCFE